MDWLAAHQRGLFFALNGHPEGALARALAVALLTVSYRGLCWWVMAALAFAIGGRRGRRLALTAALALALAALGSWALRGLAQSAPPAAQYGSVYALAAFVPRFSFPSARAAAAAAALPFFGRGRGGRVGVWALALLVGDAGVYAGAHLPSDLVGGAVVGLAAAGGAIWLFGNPFRTARGTYVPFSRRTRPRRFSG